MAAGVKFLAAVSLTIGVVFSLIMINTLISEEMLQKGNDNKLDEKPGSSQSLKHVFGIHLDRTSIDLIVILILIISVMTILSSILLLVGIKKNKPSLVLSYFGFAVFLSLMMTAIAILQLLKSLWYTSVVTLFAAILLLMRLPSIYSVYENMSKEAEPRLITEDLIDNEYVTNIDIET